ncbi:NAD kinase [Millisia brevis]|uniref:NAD kinase n=1 Tax=Millisia brevis TaxID=264148 RepID=UPI000835690D|nr:NAD kinase [Millisia brevis]
MTRREFLLVAHPGRADLVDTSRRVAELLAAAGVGLRILYEDRRESDPPETAGTVVLGSVDGLEVSVTDAPTAAEGCELVLALGGDGTILRAAEYAREADVPVLGINLGRIGFLAETEVDDSLESALLRVLAGDYRIEDRMTVDISVRRGSTPIGTNWALNEASIENAARLGVLEIVLEVDDRPVSSFGGDGVLVATPTGSTAYAFSAGGPIMWPDLEALLVIPSNAHALFARALVTSPDARIAVETVADGHDAHVFCDGRRVIDVPPGSRIEIRRGARPVRWVRLDSAPFADRLVRKFELPVKGWRGRTP